MYVFVSHSVSHTVLARFLVILCESKRTRDEATLCTFSFVIYLLCVVITGAVCIWYHIALCGRTISA